MISINKFNCIINYYENAIALIVVSIEDNYMSPLSKSVGLTKCFWLK